MHPWLKEFTCYVQNQLPHLTEACQYSIVLVQRYCDRYKISTVSEACDILSKYEAVSLSQVFEKLESFRNNVNRSRNVNISQNSTSVNILPKNTSVYSLLSDSSTVKITSSPTNENLQFILVVQFVLSTDDSNDTVCIHDGTATLHFSTANQTFQLRPEHFDRPCLLLKWKFIVPTAATSPQEKHTLNYMEIDEAVFQEIEPLAQNPETFHIPEFLTKYRAQKLNSVKGILVAKSPLHKMTRHTPFFFVWLGAASSSSSKMVAIAIQGMKYVSWYNCLHLYSYIELTDIKRNMLNKGTVDERKVFCNSSSSKLTIIQQVLSPSTIKSNFGTDLIMYIGVISSTTHAPFGLYELDGKLKLLICYQSHLMEGKALRNGALIRVVNVHRFQFGSSSMLCCCTLSSVELLEHSNSLSSPYYPFIPQENVLVSQCNNMSCHQYLWLIETASKMLENFVGKIIAWNLRSKIHEKLLSAFIVNNQEAFKEKRDVIKEFMDLPHSCIFSQTTTTTTTNHSVLPTYATVEHVFKRSREISELQEWFNGLEFDLFTSLSHQKRPKWLYCALDANNWKGSKITCGVVIGNKATFTLRDATGSIHVICPSLNVPLNRHMVLIKKFKVIVEKYFYVELHKATGEKSEKEHTKAYLFVQSKDDILILHDCHNASSTGDTKQAAGNRNVAGDSRQDNSTGKALAKKTKTDENICETSSLSGFIVSREFKRNTNCVYDVEVQPNGDCFVPKHGRIDAKELIKTNTSLYPFATSVLVIRLQPDNDGNINGDNTNEIDDSDSKMKPKKLIQLYLDSNVLSYPLLLFPGVKLTFKNIKHCKNHSGSVYYKIEVRSTMEITNPPPFVFTKLKIVMDGLKNERESSAMERDLICFIHDEYNELLSSNNPGVACVGDKFYMTGRITFIQSIIVNWRCVVCSMEIQDGGFCKIECPGGQKKFCATITCVIDDGTAECYLNLEGDIALRLLALSSVDCDLLQQSTLRCGRIAYYRKSACNDNVTTKPTPQASKKVQCEYLLYQKSLDSTLQSMYTFYYKQFKRTDQKLGFPTTIISNGETQYHSASHPKLWFQCMDFKHVDYVKMARAYLKDY